MFLSLSWIKKMSCFVVVIKRVKKILKLIRIYNESLLLKKLNDFFLIKSLPKIPA